MKKIITLSLAVASFTFANAQIKNDRGTFTKPAAKEVAIETKMAVDFNGGGWFSLSDGILGTLNNAISSKLSVPSVSGASVKVRRFKSEKVVERFTANLSFNNTKRNNIHGTEGFDSSKTAFGLSLSYGREKHFAGAERLSTYIGWDVTAGVFTASNKSQASSAQTDLRKSSQSAFGIGVQAVTGMDYYVLPKVYLGVELNYGLNYGHAGKLNEINDAGQPHETGSSITFTPAMGGSFRMGYRF